MSNYEICMEKGHMWSVYKRETYVKAKLVLITYRCDRCEILRLQEAKLK